MKHVNTIGNVNDFIINSLAHKSHDPVDINEIVVRTVSK